MADKKFTLFELHLDEGSIQFGPSEVGDVVGKRKTEAVPAGDDDADADESDDADDAADAEGCGCPGGRAGKLLAVLVVALVVAVAARKLLGSDDALDELDDLTE